MKGPHQPDAHWQCDNCEIWLVRGWSNEKGAYSYSSASNGEIFCREPVGSIFPSWPSQRRHVPRLPDLSTIDKVEEYLSE